MPQPSHGDHGVSGPSHWLLDEELASLGSRRRTGTPAALRHEGVDVPSPWATANVAEPPRRNFLMLVAGLATALLVYALLSSADVVGVLEEVYPGDGGDSILISATMEEPGAGEFAGLRGLLAATPGATIERQVAPKGPTSSGNPKAPVGSNAGPDDGVTPPPPPAPPPVIPEVPVRELPGVEVPPLPRVDVQEPEVPELPLPEVPELP